MNIVHRSITRNNRKLLNFVSAKVLPHHFNRSQFQYDAASDVYICPANQELSYRFTRLESGLTVKTQLQRKSHPEQAYRVCLGLLNLQRSYPAARLNQACVIANRKALYQLKNIKAILQSNLDKLPDETSTQDASLPQAHENIRGPRSFH